jgi:polyisoprenoid-binding protein YceI
MRTTSRTAAVTLVALVAAALAGATATASEDAWIASGEVRYVARDALTSWSGVAPVSEIRLSFDPGDPASLRVEARLEPAAFDSGNRLRDGRARASVFETDAFPEARLVAAAVPAPEVAALELGGSLTLMLDVELTLHGVTLPYRVEARLSASRDEDGNPRYRAEAEFEVSLTAHGMRRPALLGLVTDDLVQVSLVATANPDPAPSPTTR